MPDASPLQLTILRGIHDANMTGYVTRYIHPGDLLFLEFAGTAAEKYWFNRWANDVTLEEREDTPNLPESVQAWVNQEDFVYGKLIRHLKNHNVPVILVDEMFDKDPDLKKITAIIPDPLPLSEINPDKDDLKALYAAFEESANAHVKWIMGRDKLVAKQVTDTMRRLRTDYPDLPLRAVLIQGYEHQSKQYIAKRMPELQISEHFYNTSALKLVKRLPGQQIVLAKLAAPHKFLAHELVDRLVLTWLKLDELDSQDGSSTESDQPLRNPGAVHVAEETGGLQRIINIEDDMERLSDAEAHKNLLKLLKTST